MDREKRCQEKPHERNSQSGSPIPGRAKSPLPAPFLDTPHAQQSSAAAAVSSEPVYVGTGDVRPAFAFDEPAATSSQEGGMLMGPGHPIFSGNSPYQNGPVPQPSPSNVIPPGSVPPGARFDPITPLAPVSFPSGHSTAYAGAAGQGQIPWASGEPDNDEFMPPGAFSDPVHPAQPRPPAGPGVPRQMRPPGAGPFGGGSGGAPFF